MRWFAWWNLAMVPLLAATGQSLTAFLCLSNALLWFVLTTGEQQ